MAYVEAKAEKKATPKSKFPHIHNSGQAVIRETPNGKMIHFSYLDSYSRPQAQSLPLLGPEDIAGKIKARLKRFHDAPPGTRESDESRTERKYVSAHPEEILRWAWERLDEHGQMEMAMMLDMNSHHGISDPEWLKKNAKPTIYVHGDDGELLAES